MKYLSHILLLFSLGVFVLSCERDTNGRMPDEIKVADAGLFIVTESDPFINVSDPGSYSLTTDVDVLFDSDFQKLEIMVVYNNDYTKPYLLQTIESVPSTVEITSQKIVDVIDELSSTTDIQAGDMFNIFTNITLSDGTFLPAYLSNGKPANASSIINIMGVLKGGAPNISIPVPCEFVEEDYLGVVDINENWAPDVYDYQGMVIRDPDYTGDDFGIIVQGIFDPTWELKLVVSTYDYSISGNPDEQLMGAEVFGYNDPTWSAISGTVNTCDQELVVYINGFCVDAGCFGGLPIIYTISTVPADIPGKKSSHTSNFYPAPLKPFRMVQ